MTKKKKTLGVSKSVLNKFKIRQHGPKYLPRTITSADEKIFSSLVKSAISNITKSALGTSPNIAADDPTQDALPASLARSSATTSTASNTLFRQSQSQIAAAALKALSAGRKNV